MDRRKIVVAVGVLVAAVVLVIAGALYATRAGWFAWRTSREPLPAAVPLPAGESVDLSSGVIALKEFVRYLAEATGVPVVAPPELLQREITVAAPIHDVSPEIVRALLEANGLAVVPETLPDGETVIRIRALDR